MTYSRKIIYSLVFLLSFLASAIFTQSAQAIIVPTDPDSYMSSGRASWYAYKGGMFAASPDFLKGTKLRVSRQDDPSKSIEVVINDYGPDRSIHPDRVIDLDKVAFAQLAPLSAGLVDVVIEPIIEGEKKQSQESISTTSTKLALNHPLSRTALLTSRQAFDFQAGELWQDRNTGGVYFVAYGTKRALTDRVYLESFFKGKKIMPKNRASLDALKTLAPLTFQDGSLLKSPNDSAVYLVHNQKRRAFLNADIFERLGYRWGDILTVSDKVLGQYQKADLLADSLIEEKITSDLELSSDSALLLDARSGLPIYAKNADTVRPIASLTKLVAIKVFLDTNPDWDKVVQYKVQDEEYNYEYADKSVLARLRVNDGETMTVRDLLYSSVLGSANNAVESLVRISGLSRSQFIANMNEYVRALGATNTKFVEPTGLSPENVSSATDYGLIARAVLADENLSQLSKTKDYSFSTINTKRPHYIKNSNGLFFSSTLDITGSKTGYLDESQYCLMTRARNKAGQEVIAITLGTKSKAESLKDTEKLINYGFGIEQ